MTPRANPLDDPRDAAALRRYAEELAEAVLAVLPGWVERAVTDRYEQWAGSPAPVTVLSDAREAARRTVADVAPHLRDLLEADVERQRSNPLSLLREAVGHATAVLSVAGVPPAERDAQAVRLFPDDPYELGPAAFADLGPGVREAGIAWGAAKAHVMLARRRQDRRF